MGGENRSEKNHQNSLARKADSKEISHKQEEKKRKYRLLTVILAVVIVIALIALLYTQYHIWNEASCTAAKTCTICGKTKGTPLGHDWTGASCTEKNRCLTCGEIDGSVLDHSWDAATCNAPKTCKDCGATEGTSLEHTWEDATCTNPRSCQLCKATDGNALGHTWEDATYYSPKTCSTCNSTEGYSLAKRLDDTAVQASYMDNNINFRLSNGKEVGGSAWGLSQPVTDCVSITINLNVSNLTDGNVYGEWGFWVHDLDGNWFLAEVFNYTGGTTTATLEFDSPISFDMILVPCHVLGDSWSFSYGIWLCDAWVLRS